jgi:Rrf2 family protein
LNVSAKTEYACIAMTALAGQYGRGEPVRIRAIAQNHGIPPRFLVQILLQLKNAGLVQSTRGASGGYQLAKPPQEISLGEVVAVIDGRAEGAGAATESPYTPALEVVWNEIELAERQMLAEITLADMLDRARQDVDPMYYI